jgi:3-hydroxypropanoate dehydrogenase
VFVKSKAAKERLKPHLNAGNVDKTMAAPATVIMAYDLKFFEHPPKGQDPLGGFADKPEQTLTAALRNGSLQGGYLILAARSLGLDCGPMSGFDNAGVDKEFFAGTDLKSNFLCNLGYGDPTGLRPRGPRFTFDEMAKIL